jgi:hypothetical protein
VCGMSTNEIAKVEAEVLNKLKKGFVFIVNTAGQILSVKKTEDGFMKAVRVKIKLSQQEKHFYNQQGNWQITADGFKYICKHAGVVEKRIPTITIGETTYSNPYFEFDQNRKKSKVYARSAVVGRDANGNYQVSEATILYDIMDTFINDLLTKVKSSKSAGIIVPNRQVEKILSLEEKMYWQDYPIDEYTSIIVDLENDSIRKCLSTYQNNKDMSDRKVQTMAFRNAAKKHPAIAQQNVVPYKDDDGFMVADISIIKWLDTIPEEEQQMIDDYLESDAAITEFELFSDEETSIEESEETEIVDDAEEEPFVEIELEDEILVVIDEEEQDPEKKELFGWILNSPMTRDEIDHLIEDEMKSKKKVEELSISQLNTLKVLINNKYK